MSLVVAGEALVGVARRADHGTWRRIDPREARGDRPMCTIVLGEVSWSVFDAGEIQQVSLRLSSRRDTRSVRDWTPG